MPDRQRRAKGRRHLMPTANAKGDAGAKLVANAAKLYWQLARRRETWGSAHPCERSAAFSRAWPHHASWAAL